MKLTQQRRKKYNVLHSMDYLKQEQTAEYSFPGLSN